MDAIIQGKVNYKKPFMSFKSEETIAKSLIPELSEEFNISPSEIKHAIHLAWEELAACRNDIRRKGEETINQHFDIIQNHTSPKPDRTIEGISAQIFAQRDNLKNEGFKEYVFIANRKCCEICAKLNGNHFLLEELKTGVNAPPMHDGCCCAIAAYKNKGTDAIDDDDEYEQWLDFISKGGTTKQWEKRKNNKRW